MRADLEARDLSPDCSSGTRHIIVVELLANVRQRRSLAELARHLDLSPSRLEHVFKAETGVALRTFAINLRLHQAASMLLTENVQIKTIQYETGFNHPANFSHLFRKHHGVSATEFRRLYLGRQEKPIDCACDANAIRLVQLAMRVWSGWRK
jgi:transcriptional regulator GlxA family with amidase domain